MNSKTSYLILVVAALCAGAVAKATPVQEVTLLVPKQESTSLLGWADLSLDYSVRTDLNSDKSPNAYAHALDLSLSKQFGPYTAFISGGVDYTTLGATVYRQTNKENYYSLRDASAGATRSYVLSGRNSLSLFVTEDILLSDDSRYFGYRSVTGGKLGLTTRVTSWLSARQTVDGSYILNRYRFAPVSSGKIHIGDINPDSLATYGVGPVFTLMKGLKLSATLAVRATHYLDGTYLYGFGNSYSLVYASGHWSAWMKYLNKGYADRGETSLWFADEYRRLASAGITVDF